MKTPKTMTRMTLTKMTMTTMTSRDPVALLMLCLPLLSCSSPDKAMAAPAAVPAAAHEGKITAPVRVKLSASAKTGTVVVTLSVQALADIPRGVARIVLPAEVKLVSGQPE